MHLRRLATLLLGAWISGTVLMLGIATANLGGAERMLASPARGAAPMLKSLGAENARALLRYQSAELSRWNIKLWERAQLALGLALLAVLAVGAQGRRPAPLLCSMMLLAVLVMRVYLTPEIDRLGRALDFAPAGQLTAERHRLGNFHLAYTLIELIKMGLSLTLALTLLHRSHRKASRTEERPRRARAR